MATRSHALFDFTAVDAAVSGCVDRHELPHAALLVARDGCVVHRMTTGMARRDGTPLRPDAKFRLASLTKPMTIALGLQLVDDGVIALDTPLAGVLPDLADLRVWRGPGHPLWATEALARPLFVADLMTHRAGFAYSFDGGDALSAAYRDLRIDDMRSPLSGAERLAALARLPLAFQPGTGWRYSFAIDVLAMAIERLTGETFGHVMRERILDPLAMHDSGFFVPGGDRLTDAWMIDPARGLRVYDHAERGSWSRPPPFESGGAGLVATIDDLFRFAEAMRTGRAGRIDDGPTGGRVPGHDSLFGSFMSIDQTRGVNILFLTHCIGADRASIHDTIAGLVSAALADSAAP